MVAYVLKSFSILCAGVYKGLQIKLVQDFAHQLSAENMIPETTGEDAFWYAQYTSFKNHDFNAVTLELKQAALVHTNTHVHILRAVWLLAQGKLCGPIFLGPPRRRLCRSTTASRPPHDRLTTASRPPLGNKTFCEPH